MNHDGEFNHGGHGDSSGARKPARSAAREGRSGSCEQHGDKAILNRDGATDATGGEASDDEGPAVRVLEVLVSWPFRWLLLLTGVLVIGGVVYFWGFR